MKTLADLQQIVSRVRYKGWNFDVAMMGGTFYLQVKFLAPDALNGSLDVQTSRRWLLSPHSTESEVAGTCLKAVLTAEEHEAREQFTYAGEAVFSPHFDVVHLHELAKRARTGGAR